MIPDRSECLKILEQEKVPAHIVAHSELVARVAAAVGALLLEKGQPLDPGLLLAGALLHDISKMRTIENGGNHALLGGERVAELGYPELSPLVARHVDLGEWDRHGPVTEAELVNYADKRVKHSEVVPLRERFDDLLTRYGKTDFARERISAHRETLLLVEEKIVAILGDDSHKLLFEEGPDPL